MIVWPVFRTEALAVIRLNESAQKARDLEMLLDQCVTAQMKVEVLMHCLANATIFINHNDGLAAHKDNVVYGHIISSYTVSGGCNITFEQKSDPIWNHSIALQQGSFYSFAGPLRDSATHGIEIQGKQKATGTPPRVSLLLRYWLPGRLNLVWHLVRAKRPSEKDRWLYRILGSGTKDYYDDKGPEPSFTESEVMVSSWSFNK